MNFKNIEDLKQWLDMLADEVNVNNIEFGLKGDGKTIYYERVSRKFKLK